MSYEQLAEPARRVFRRLAVVPGRDYDAALAAVVGEVPVDVAWDALDETFMGTKITVIYDNPVSADDFEAGYPEQVALGRKLPGVERIESSRVWPKEDGSPTPAYRLFDLYFADYDAASRAVTTPEAGAFVTQVQKLATGGVRIVFADVEEI